MGSLLPVVKIPVLYLKKYIYVFLIIVGVLQFKPRKLPLVLRSMISVSGNMQSFVIQSIHPVVSGGVFF